MKHQLIISQLLIKTINHKFDFPPW